MKIQAACCNECLFSKNKIVSASRKRSVLANCERYDTHFTCHKTSDVMCHGFYKKIGMKRPTNLMRIAMRLGSIEFVEVNNHA